MTIEFRQLRFAVATADLQSFARAAHSMRVKQSTLSRQVLDLELSLGVKLFERTTRGAEVTDTGRTFIDHARRIVTDVDNLKTTARNVRYGLQGRLAVGFCTSLMAGNLKLAFSDFLARFPDVQFDGIEAGPAKLLQGLQARTIDVAIAPSGLAEPGLLSSPLWSERILVALHDESPLIQHDRLYWQELRREVFVVSNVGLGPIFGNLISARLTEQGSQPNVIVQETSLESVLSMVSAKRYITVATEASQGVVWPEVRFKELYDPTGPARLEFAIYWRSESKNAALAQFMGLIRGRHLGLIDGEKTNFGERH
jgi:DNA-binding transcriptional LysR family regulator